MNHYLNPRLLLAALLILVLAQIPYLVGWMLSSDDQIFSGIIFYHGDSFSYLAKIREGYEGRWLYENRYTAEPARPALLFTFYLAIGHIARWLGVSIPLAFHLARLFSGALLLASVLRWASLLRFNFWARCIALLLGGLGSGLGWLVVYLEITTIPPDTWYTDAYSFSSMLMFPHFALAMALLAFALADLTDAVRSDPLRWGLLLRLCAFVFLLAWVHPRIMITFAVVGGGGCALGMIRGLWNFKRAALTFLPALFSGAVPCVLMQRSYAGDPIWTEWAATRIPTASPLWMIEAYGVMWLLAIYALPAAIRRRQPWSAFLLAWFTLGIALPYLPIPILAGGRMIQGYGIVLALLSAHAISRRIIPRVRFALRPNLRAEKRLWVRRSLAPLLTLPLVVLPLVSSIRIFNDGVNVARSLRYPMHYSVERIAMMNWLGTQTPPNVVVLASPMTSLMIPAFSGRRVVVGHWAETHRRIEKEQMVGEFFNPQISPEQRDLIFAQLSADLVVHGVFERALGAFDPALDSQRWQLVFDQNGLRVFRRIPA